MVSTEVGNHIELLFSEILRFYLSQSMIAEKVDPYTLEDDEFNDSLKKVIDDIKKVINIIMNDILQQQEEQYLENRKFLKSVNFIGLNQNQ